MWDSQSFLTWLSTLKPHPGTCCNTQKSLQQIKLNLDLGTSLLSVLAGSSKPYDISQILCMDVCSYIFNVTNRKNQINQVSSIQMAAKGRRRYEEGTGCESSCMQSGQKQRTAADEGCRALHHNQPVSAGLHTLSLGEAGLFTKRWPFQNIPEGVSSALAWAGPKVVLQFCTVVSLKFLLEQLQSG